jgi:hypothetical protein
MAISPACGWGRGGFISSIIRPSSAKRSSPLVSVACPVLAGEKEIMELTQEQRDLLKKGEIVELTDPSVGTVIVLLPHVYEAITDALEDEQLDSLAKKAADEWARDNPY